MVMGPGYIEPNEPLEGPGGEVALLAAPSGEGGTPTYEYDLCWEPDTLAYYQGDQAPLQWTIVNRKGQILPALSITVTVYRPDGNTDEPATYGVGQETPSLLAGAIYKFPAIPGLYAVRITISDSQPAPQVRSNQVSVVVD